MSVSCLFAWPAQLVYSQLMPAVVGCWDTGMSYGKESWRRSSWHFGDGVRGKRDQKVFYYIAGDKVWGLDLGEKKQVWICNQPTYWLDWSIPWGVCSGCFWRKVRRGRSLQSTGDGVQGRIPYGFCWKAGYETWGLDFLMAGGTCQNPQLTYLFSWPCSTAVIPVNTI